MLDLLDRIEECDRNLKKLTARRTPNLTAISHITSRKERFLIQLDNKSRCVRQADDKLKSILEVCQQVYQHPKYAQLMQLSALTRYRINEVIEKEDTNNPEIVQRLNEYRKSLELDIKISRVPVQQKRRMFMFRMNMK
jgi:hypothetical protein